MGVKCSKIDSILLVPLQYVLHMHGAVQSNDRIAALLHFSQDEFVDNRIVHPVGRGLWYTNACRSFIVCDIVAMYMPIAI